jgi:UDP-N-acetylglucosamine--N-acetylmuramyl-(pentapeptide) pyrophosphoryl-undecaprenol N-acetylglucosamine transferase
VNFLFACGGTGGHIFPAMAVAEELTKRLPDAKVYFAGGDREIENEIFRSVPSSSVVSVESAPFRGASSFADPRFLLKLAKGYSQSRALLKKLRPALVVGFGGYVSFPVLMAAKQMGFKTALHEQNVVPGRANRMLAGWVDAVASTYEESKASFKNVRNLRVTGNPIRASIEADRREEAIGHFGFEGGRRTLLVLGGSQGAESVNKVFLASLEFWTPEMKQGLQVLHLCGKMAPSEAERACADAGVPARAFSFFDRMDLAYGAADLCVARAGATFLAEIAVKGIPAILIPYPYADGHQRANAKVFAASHRAMIAEQLTLKPDKLAEYLGSFYGGAAAEDRKPDAHAKGARARLAEFLEECARS